MTAELPENDRKALAELLISVADDKLILGHRNADWTGLAPMLEEDIAFSSLAQDEIAHASTLYEIAASLLNTTADRLAYGRPAPDYRCAEIVVFSDEFDWAVALARSFFCDHFDALRLARLAKCSYRPVAELAARLVSEEQIHVDHVDSWIVRLGQGGKESKERLQGALDRVGRLAPTLFETNDGIRFAEKSGYYQGDEATMFAEWLAALKAVAKNASLSLAIPEPGPKYTGGRSGVHSAGFVPLLDELTEVYRIEPEAAW